MTASLSKMDLQLRSGRRGLEFERDRRAFEHVFDLFELEIRSNDRELRKNADESMLAASTAARRHNDSLPNSDYIIHESSPIAKGTGRPVLVENVLQFPGDSPASGSKKNGRLKKADMRS
jgi:hypothetical protein